MENNITTTLMENILKNATENSTGETESLDDTIDPDLGNRYKILAMVILGLGSMLAGVLPTTISHRHRAENFFISLLLCFGGGVLLATALVHILADVRKDMPENAEIYLCIGFFVIYFIDEFIHFCFGEALKHMHNSNDGNGHAASHSHGSNHNHYGSAELLVDETESLLNNGHHGNNHSHHQPGELCDADEGNARICYTSHEEPCAETSTGALGLLTALSIHSIIEGLAIGLQSTSTGVLVLLIAVACHKFVMSFCLGLEIRMTSNSSFKKLLLAVTIFSLGSVSGIAIGMAIDGLPSTWNKSAFPILQALAGGTLLYVTVCEVLPRERARWHQKANKRWAGIGQFLAVAIGFGAMTLVNYYLEH